MKKSKIVKKPKHETTSNAAIVRAYENWTASRKRLDQLKPFALEPPNIDADIMGLLSKSKDTVIYFADVLIFLFTNHWESNLASERGSAKKKPRRNPKLESWVLAERAKGRAAGIICAQLERMTKAKLRKAIDQDGAPARRTIDRIFLDAQKSAPSR